MAESFPPIPEVNQAHADFFMSAPDHLHIRQQIIDTADDLALLQTPHTFTTKLKDIPITGEMPLSLLPVLGGHHSRLEFSAEKRIHDIGDAAVSLWLLGSEKRLEQLQLVSEKTPVEYGRDKLFMLLPYGSTEPVGALSFADLGLALDNLVPKAGNLSGLADPRKKNAFDLIAYAMGDALRPLALRREAERTYLAKDYNISQIGTESYMGEVGSRLVVGEKDGVTNFRLSVTAPQDLQDGRVLEHYEYRFTPGDNDPSNGQARLTLISREVSRAALKRYVKSTAAGVSPTQVGDQALNLLRTEIQSIA